MTILSGAARLAGITGWPVSHSRSPRLHGFWLERYGIDGAYVPLPIDPAHFPAAIRGLMFSGFAGVNVTIPHKVAAFEICDTVDVSARRAGAVNTLVFENGRISGSNTDGWGFLENLRANDVDPTAGPALILGAGGSARAIAAVLLDLGIKVTVANRARVRAEQLASELQGLAVIDWNARSVALPDHALLVNTTSLGMAGHSPLEIDLDRAAACLTVADIVYVPLETPLLAAARARRIRCVEGLGMLLYQAVPGFRTWFGVDPTVDDALRRFVAADLLTSVRIIGLTGGIGMGKSTAAAAFRRARIPVFDADLAVHRMQAKGGRAVKAIEAAFPGTTHNGAVDRAALRQSGPRQPGGPDTPGAYSAPNGGSRGTRFRRPGAAQRPAGGCAGYPPAVRDQGRQAGRYRRGGFRPPRGPDLPRWSPPPHEQGRRRGGHRAPDARF